MRPTIPQGRFQFMKIGGPTISRTEYLFIYIANPAQDSEALRDTQWPGIEFNLCDMFELSD